MLSDSPQLYRLIPLELLRKTPGIHFDAVSEVPKIDGIDRVVHEPGGTSPGPVGGVDRPWYMHPGQDDNLLVLMGTRFVDIYSVLLGRGESFEVTPERVRRKNHTTGEWEMFYDGAAMLVWPINVFHRIQSGEEGSISVNFATRYDTFDIRTNFSIYDLDTRTGKYKILREGHLDQPKTS